MFDSPVDAPVSDMYISTFGPLDLLSIQTATQLNLQFPFQTQSQLPQTNHTNNTTMTKPMNMSSASRIQSTQAKTGGDMSSGGFAARAQSAAATNANASNTTTSTSNAGNNGSAKK